MDISKERYPQLKLLMGVIVMLMVAAAFSFPKGTDSAVTVNIKIFKGENNSCFYELSNVDGDLLPNQVMFTTKPSDDIKFTADGIDAHVVADGQKEDGEGKGKSAFVGGPRDASFFLDNENNRTETKKVRPSKGHKSTHRINMSCLIADPAPDALKVGGPHSEDYAGYVLVPARPWGDYSNQAPEPDMTVEDP